MEMTGSLAKELAELQIIRADLKAALDTLSLWFSKYAPQTNQLSDEGRLISQSFFRDSLVMFVGCFDKTAASTSLSETAIYGSVRGGLAYFKWLKDIRDAYAAHKFGPFRQCVAGVALDTDEDL